MMTGKTAPADSEISNVIPVLTRILWHGMYVRGHGRQGKQVRRKCNVPGTQCTRPHAKCTTKRTRLRHLSNPVLRVSLSSPRRPSRSAAFFVSRSRSSACRFVTALGTVAVEWPRRVRLTAFCLVPRASSSPDRCDLSSSTCLWRTSLEAEMSEAVAAISLIVSRQSMS